jgi:type II secretory pathway pseudopilin PulG
MINKSKNSGFTLLETLVAVLILMLAVTGPLTIAFKGFNAVSVAKEQIVAYFLAQDAIEFIRFARDTNRLSGSDWLTGSAYNLSNCISNKCYFDSTGSASPLQCTAGVCSLMKYDSATGKYQYTSGVNTIYRRTVTIIPVGAGTTEVIASSTISWVGVGNVNRSATIFENIFDWQ